ncbi:5466_t:CDS:1, partial [Racocetra persica]
NRLCIVRKIDESELHEPFTRNRVKKLKERLKITNVELIINSVDFKDASQAPIMIRIGFQSSVG